MVKLKILTRQISSRGTIKRFTVANSNVSTRREEVPTEETRHTLPACGAAALVGDSGATAGERAHLKGKKNIEFL